MVFFFFLLSLTERLCARPTEAGIGSGTVSSLDSSSPIEQDSGYSVFTF